MVVAVFCVFCEKSATILNRVVYEFLLDFVKVMLRPCPFSEYKGAR